MTPAFTRAANGQFTPGRSGNPAGRPKGARNKATLFAEMLRDGQSEALIQALVARALGGDQVALRFCVGRLVPKPGPAPVALDLPPGAEGDPDAVVTAAIRAMADGEIAPQEAVAIARVAVAACKAKGRGRAAARQTATMPAPEPASPAEAAGLAARPVAAEKSAPASEAPPVFCLYPAGPVAPASAPRSAGTTVRSLALASAAPVFGQYFPVPTQRGANLKTLSRLRERAG